MTELPPFYVVRVAVSGVLSMWPSCAAAVRAGHARPGLAQVAGTAELAQERGKAMIVLGGVATAGSLVVMWVREICRSGVRARAAAVSRGRHWSGRFMRVRLSRGAWRPATPATASRRAAGITVTVVLALLACGCATHQARSPAASGRATSSPSPSATPMTAAELAWVAAVTHLQKKIDKPFGPHNLYMTREKMTQLGTTLRGCSRELRRIGVPSGRLQPVYALVKRACRTYDKAARCFARAANVSDASGATFAGTPQDRIQRRSLSCGFAAQGNASNRLGDAQSQAQLIESQAS